MPEWLTWVLSIAGDTQPNSVISDDDIRALSPAHGPRFLDVFAKRQQRILEICHDVPTYNKLCMYQLYILRQAQATRVNSAIMQEYLRTGSTETLEQVATSQPGVYKAAKELLASSSYQLRYAIALPALEGMQLLRAVATCISHKAITERSMPIAGI